MEYPNAAKMVSLMDSSDAAYLLSELEYDQSAEILSKIKVALAAAVVAEMEYYDAGGVLSKMDLSKAVALLRAGDVDAEAIFEEMEDKKMIREMTSEALENGEAVTQLVATLLQTDPSPQVFNAVLTAMAILDVAKLPKFRAQLAPHCASEKQVLADVLENWPQVLPSFVRMPQESQSLAKDCLTSEFIFAQFIWAEIPPASVTAVKTMLSASRKSLSGLMDKTKYLNVFLYCVFVEMSASQSQKLEGSLYMTEDRWKEFEVGKDAILRLEQESEQVDHGYHGCDKGFVLETDLSE
eukprot:symbB.v1.2.035110.t1/scaffold4661.1/size36769/1